MTKQIKFCTHHIEMTGVIIANNIFQRIEYREAILYLGKFKCR